MTYNIWRTPPRLLPEPQSTEGFEPYAEIVEDSDGRVLEFAHSISYMPRHYDFSFEELRLNDIHKGRGIVDRPSSGQFTTATNALAFASIQEWLYSNHIPSNNFGDISKENAEYNHLVHAFIIGEKLIDVGFKDAIIDCIIDKLRKSSYFDTRLTNVVYENTPLRS